MLDPVMCLGCGGLVDQGEGVPPGEARCTCPPPSLPPRVHARGVALPVCPRCLGELGARRYAALDVDECAGCGGLFVPPPMMDRIVAAHDAREALHLALPVRRAVRETGVHYLHCPSCDKLMNRKTFGRVSGVIVDVCKEHGIWFDAGKLDEVMAFIEHGGLEKARRHDEEDRADAARAAKAAAVHEQFTRGLTQARSGGGWFGRPGYAGSQSAHDLLWALADLWR